MSYVDGDGDHVTFSDSRRGLEKYVNNVLKKVVKSLRYNRATYDLRDHEGWGGALPKNAAKNIASELEQVCQQLGIPFSAVGVES